MALLLLCFLISAHAYTVQLDPWGDDSIRIRIAPNGSPIVDQTLMALLPTAPPSTTAVSRVGATLSNGNLNVAVDETTGLVTATRLSDKKVLLQANSLVFATPTVPVTKSGSVSTTLTFAGHGTNERIYGLGEHRTGKVNQMPYSKIFVQSQLYTYSSGGDVSIPWYCSSEGYGFLWNLPSYGSVNITGTAITWFSDASLNADFWITTTSATLDQSTSPYANMMSHYIDAVGHAPMMPYYSTGFIQCKDRYRNQTQLLDVAVGYVSRGLPISVIVIDWEHWINQGDWTFNAACWPDPQGMVDELRTLGIELMVTFWPYVANPSSHYQEFSSNNYLVPLINGTMAYYDWPGYLYDSTNPKAQAATAQAWQDGYGKYGIKTVWVDAAEPERDDETLVGQWLLSQGTDAEIGEAWTQQHVKALADGMASNGIGPSDYFVLPRSVWVGSWRYSAALWSGDINSQFSELAIQIKVAQGVAMSGIVLWTTDIGGYNGGDPSNAEFQDLIVRWFQFGAFCPLFRLHGHRAGGPPSDECGATNGDNEVWNLAQEPTHYNGIVRVMELRENLREYVYQINEIASKTGLPMLRPMFLQWPNDANCQSSDVEDQFMFGDDWLVAPVYVYQATNRSVYLPTLASNETWVYFYNQTEYGPGGSRVTVQTPINEFPLFYRRATQPVAYANATNLWSTERNDTVLCLSSTCYTDNAPSDSGNYGILFVDSYGIISSPEPYITVDGKNYDLVKLNLFYSSSHADNFVATNTSAPDATYTITFGNGYVLAQQAPGSLPLQVYYKDYGNNSWDYLTAASSSSITWATTNGYTFKFTTGYIFPVGYVGKNDFFLQQTLKNNFKQTTQFAKFV